MELTRLFSEDYTIIFFFEFNGILLPKLFWPTVRKNCSKVSFYGQCSRMQLIPLKETYFSDREKLLKFGDESQESENFLRSLEQ